jgi:hypothetical protein
MDPFVAFAPLKSTALNGPSPVRESGLMSPLRRPEIPAGI